MSERGNQSDAVDNESLPEGPKESIGGCLWQKRLRNRVESDGGGMLVLFLA